MPDTLSAAPPIPDAAAYDQDYLAWKDWNIEQFGHLPPQAKAQFEAEMRRTGLDLGRKLDVFEVGFGNGEFLTYARQKGWNVRGMEANLRLVEVARAKAYDALLGTDLRQLPDNSFDLVAAFNVLEHIRQNDIPGFLNEVKRILRPGGVFVAVFPNGDSAIGLIYQNGDVTHVTFIGSGKVEYFANLTGADIVYVGAEAMPLFAGTPFHTVHRALSLPIRAFLNLLFRFVFFPRRKLAYFSVNLTAILRYAKKAG